MSNDIGKFSTQGSGILAEALTLRPCKHSEATHFALCYGSKIKFLINLKGGIPHLRATVAVYNKKLAMLLRLLPFTPWSILQCCRMGYFASVELHPAVSRVIPPENKWNILVGAYDNAQKLVIQSYHQNQGNTRSYIKIGNAGSATQMENEINFLRSAPSYQTFSLPVFRDSCLINEGYPFNLLVTDEFHGQKSHPELTDDIYHITKEIAGETTFINGVPHTFSHGDFAPWNLRKNSTGYTVFDWEHCGMRPVGYDAAYFVIMFEIALNKRSFHDAFHIAQEQIKNKDPEIHLNKELIFQHFSKTTKTLSY